MRQPTTARAGPRLLGPRATCLRRARRFTRQRARHQCAVSCNQSTHTGLRAAWGIYHFYFCSSRVLPFT
eukprot:3149112-Prymnesium_polylepis.1